MPGASRILKPLGLPKLQRQTTLTTNDNKDTNDLNDKGQTTLKTNDDNDTNDSGVMSSNYTHNFGQVFETNCFF